jgi:antibiotic biosynthesis monooxygenase (ABM) superfamily enzyme
MYGTIARIKVKPDKVRELYALGQQWDDQRKRVPGFISTEILWEERETGRALMIVRFTNKELYFQNANSPEQHQFYLRMRACLESDPEWNDGYYDKWDSLYHRPPAFLTGEPPKEKTPADR